MPIRPTSRWGQIILGTLNPETLSLISPNPYSANKPDAKVGPDDSENPKP